KDSAENPSGKATTGTTRLSNKRYPSFTTRRDVAHMLSQCINMKAHYKWLYDTYWCATLPQLMKRLSKDGVFETLANSGTSISALEEASSHMEIAYELDGPMIICVLIMFHITLSTPLLKVRTEAAFKTFITTKRPVTDLIGEAEKNRGAVVYDETYNLNSVSLESFHRYQCLCQARSPNTWTDLTDYMVT
ncbi:hypothetical protein FOZ63_021987, partial [Perkinsus olseni]